jgi:tight adherence protein C
MNPAVAVLLGAGAGAGIWLTVAALWPWRPALAREVAELDATGAVVDDAPLASPFADRAVRWGFPGEETRADLDCLGQSIPEFLRRTVRGVGLGSVIGLACGTGLLVAGVANALLAFTATAAGAVFGLIVTVASTHQRAEEQRGEYRRLLAAMLDLIAVSLAGSAGVETALNEAVAAGHGPTADTVRSVIAKARLKRVTPWDALAELGQRIGVTEYTQLGAAIGLAGTEGARVRDALTARADTMRGNRQAAIEAGEAETTERMSLPIVELAGGFLLFIVLAAMATILGTV